MTYLFPNSSLLVFWSIAYSICGILAFQPQPLASRNTDYIIFARFLHNKTFKSQIFILGSNNVRIYVGVGP